MARLVAEYDGLSRARRAEQQHDSDADDEAEDLQLFTLEVDEDEYVSLLAAPAPTRGGEVSLKDLNAEERALFLASDKLEWEAILKTWAVHVLVGKEAEEARRAYPERVISSRMVRRKKPQPELHSWKAKSRWCLHAQVDPDTGTLTTYAPTPQAESIQMFLQTSVNYGMKMKVAFGDIKNAFASHYRSSVRGVLSLLNPVKGCSSCCPRERSFAYRCAGIWS